MIYITVEPKSIARAVLSSINTVIALGDAADRILADVSAKLDLKPPVLGPTTLEPGEILLWFIQKESPPFKLKIVPSRTGLRRHRRKYAEGDLGPERSFYFEGPKKQLKLRAQNLVLFVQWAEGVDDDTWIYHLRQGDYSQWFRDVIKDQVLAAEAARIEGLTEVSPAESRDLIKAAITERYTAPS
jgi:hypothetical protein